MQADVLTRDDLVQSIVPNPTMIVTAKGVYNEFVKVSADISSISSECRNFPTMEWIENQHYLTAHQPISHKLNTQTFARLSSTFLTAHQSLSALNEYYNKSETSSAAELAFAFSKSPEYLYVDFDKLYNDSPDKYVSAYIGADISATFISEVNRINEIIIYTAMTDVQKITEGIETEDIGLLSDRTLVICSHAGMPLSSIHVDTLSGIASALNTAAEKLKIYGPGATLSQIFKTYLIRNRVLEFKLAQLGSVVKQIVSQQSTEVESLREEVADLKQTLKNFAQVLKNTNVSEDPYVFEVADKVDDIIDTTNNAAEVLLNIE